MKQFDELGIKAELVKALAKEAITEAMPVQEVAIPPLVSGVDAYVSAATGTGKTLAYLLPIFERMEVQVPQAQALVLAPTHELASQIHQEALKLSQHAGLGVRSLLLIGGANIKRQLEKLKKKPHLVIGSAGRMVELSRMKKLKLHKIQTLVVDEADRVLVGERVEDVHTLLKAMPPERQCVFVSATEQPISFEVAKQIAPHLERLSAGANQINRSIEHLYLYAPAREKADLLRRLIRATNPERAMVFVHRNVDAELVRAKMEHYKIPVADIHGTREKLQRKQAMDDFRKGKAQVLIASDVAARGLDVKGVTHIFNYDAPAQSKDYLHRVGRTGRAGIQGYAITLVTEQEARLVTRYAKELDIVLHEAFMREGQIFSAEEVNESAAE